MIYIEELRKNIEMELKMVKELDSFVDRSLTSSESKIYQDMTNSIIRKIKISNNSIPLIIKEIKLEKSIKEVNKSNFSKVKVSNDYISIKNKDKKEFIKELAINEKLLNKIRKKKLIEIDDIKEIAKPSIYGKISNRIFLKFSDKMISKGNFKSLMLDLRRSNLNILSTTYLSMTLLSIFISIIVGFLLFLFLMFYSVGLNSPYLSLNQGNDLTRFTQVFWVIFALPLIVWIIFYVYPGGEKRTLAKKIDQELPFAVIHMASVSGSGVEPSEIFRIIALSKQYKHTRQEAKKILNQTNVYGYDLTNALRNVALSTPSSKLAELLNGISITINSGGDIKTFFEKRAESLLLEYRLEREKYTKTAETFMDIYISIVIAAPMILLMLLIMISVSRIQTGFSVNQLTVGIMGIVAIINILFLSFLHLKQPSY